MEVGGTRSVWVRWEGKKRSTALSASPPSLLSNKGLEHALGQRQGCASPEEGHPESTLKRCTLFKVLVELGA